MKNQPQKVQYTLDYKHRVNFTCPNPNCRYENCTAAYADNLIYSDTINEGICALCKTPYVLVKR